MMKRNHLRICLAALLLTALTGCSSMAPKEKTIILSETSVQPQESSSAQSAQGFEVKKITKLPLDKLDPNGLHPDVQKGIIGWLDEDNLVAMSVLLSTADEEAQQEGEAAAEQVQTQFTRINYQYGFYDPVLTLENVEAECFDVSADGELVAYVAGNELSVYSLHNGAPVQSRTREVLASRVTFAQSGHELYFTAAGESKQLERLDADTGDVRSVLDGKSYRALAAGDKGMLLMVQAQGSEAISYYSEGILEESILTESKSTTSCILPSGEGLISYGGNLYLIGSGGAELVQSNVIAFDIASDGMHVAFARRNDDDTVDICIGYWGGKSIINDRLTYKDIGIEVNAMYFSPDVRKLYLQGTNDAGSLMAYTFEFQ